MIERMEGDVKGLAESGFLLGLGSVTVFLHASRSLLGSLAVGRRVSLPVHVQLQMEGNRMVPVAVAFGSELEKELFDEFLSVSGIGARAAVRALARPAEEIAAAIATGDERFLTTLPGIGRAKARQILASLQERLSKRFPSAAGSSETEPAGSAARDVLLRLGLGMPEADELVKKAMAALGEPAAAGEIVREAMRIRSEG